MRRWDRLMDAYSWECRQRGLAESTLVHIDRELLRWGAWLKRRRPTPRLEEVDVPLIVAYVRSRTPFRSKATVSSTMSVMRGMGEFLVREGIWRSNPLRWLQGPKLDARMRVPRRIGSEAMGQLWGAAAVQSSPYPRQLWTAVLAVLYGTGLRRGELERLDFADWDRTAEVLQIDGRKTGCARRVPLPQLAVDCLEAYVPYRQGKIERLGRLGEPALFVNRRGQRLSGPAVSLGVSRLARQAGLEGITLHGFRHSCASDLLESGVRLAEVQAVLGHRDVSTTVRYLAIADRQRRAAVDRHPINDWLREDAA